MEDVFEKNNINPEPRAEDSTVRNQAGSDMLSMIFTLFTEHTMPEFCFFNKGKHIAALEISDAEKSGQLTGEGWKKQFEEVRATDAESALTRLADMRKEEVTTEHVFVTGSVFSSILTVILK